MCSHPAEINKFISHILNLQEHVTGLVILYGRIAKAKKARWSVSFAWLIFSYIRRSSLGSCVQDMWYVFFTLPLVNKWHSICIIAIPNFSAQYRARNRSFVARVGVSQGLCYHAEAKTSIERRQDWIGKGCPWILVGNWRNPCVTWCISSFRPRERKAPIHSLPDCRGQASSSLSGHVSTFIWKYRTSEGYTTNISELCWMDAIQWVNAHSHLLSGSPNNQRNRPLIPEGYR